MTQIRQTGLIVACLAMLLSVAGLATKGINFGIEFTGGVVTEFTSTKPLEHVDLLATLDDVIDGEVGGREVEGAVLRVERVERERHGARDLDDGVGEERHLVRGGGAQPSHVVEHALPAELRELVDEQVGPPEVVNVGGGEADEGEAVLDQHAVVVPCDLEACVINGGRVEGD